MKNKKWLITLIIILTIIMIVLIYFFVNLLQGNFNLKGFKINFPTSNELILDKTYEEEFNKIIINSTTSEIFIKKSNNKNIKTIIYGEKDYTNVETSLDTLNIKINEKNCLGFCFIKKSAQVEIYLPEDFNGNITIKNTYGDIFIDEFLKVNLDIDEDCGDIKILGGNTIKVNNNYGNIEIEKVNNSTINADCGDILISSVFDATIKSDYGDIKIKSITNYLNLKTDCGDIEIDHLNLNKNSYIKSDYGNINIGNTNELFIDAKTDLGKLKIKNNYNKSDITLKIENDCGDIKVNN